MFIEEINALEAGVAKLAPVKTEEKKGIMGMVSSAASAAKDAVSADFHVHFREIPRYRRKNIEKAHGPVEGEFLVCFDLDRVGSEDASVYITDRWISFRSSSGLLTGVDLTLRIHWSWLAEVKRKDEHLDFHLKEPKDAPPLRVSWEPFFDDRIAHMNEMVNFLERVLQKKLTGGPEHSFQLLQALKELADDNPSGMKLLKEAQVGVDQMFGQAGIKSHLLDVRSLLESDLILEKCRIAPPSRELYHDIITTIRVLEQEKEKTEGYADRHKIDDNLKMLLERMQSTLFGMEARDRGTLFMEDELPTATPTNFIGGRFDWAARFSFPTGHPKSREMYIVHPLASNRYLPLEGFDGLLNEEKRHEFFTLVRALGAKKIKYRNLISTEQRTSEKKTKSLTQGTSAAPGVPMGMVSGSLGSEDTVSAQNQTSSAVSSETDLFVESEFAPTVAPHVPEGLLWYGSELDWQRLASDRLEAGLKSTKLVLKTSRREYFSQTDELAIQKELTALYSGVKVNSVSGFSQKRESEQEGKEEKAIEIIIDF